ncbi:MAG: methyltransferase domain-containing protein [Candidatus Wallbacteria bacterium]|nr:methyltransferase domain-containing protein [Candidatus Wallbacteria bacterium]
MKRNWQNFWSDKTDGGHRQNDESYLALEAREKLFHLGSGGSILDFGCGAAELLSYFAGAFNYAVGADFSSSMLGSAEKRLKSLGINNVNLIQADDRTVWSKLDRKFDRITCGQVVQYFNSRMLDEFLGNCKKSLNPGGKIILFDVIDPRIYLLYHYRIIGNQKPQAVRLFYAAAIFCRDLFHLLSFTPLCELGFAHHPESMSRIAARHGFKMTRVGSMYYEYRYHAVLEED